MSKDLYTITKHRLEALKVFNATVIEHVAQFAKTQDNYSSYQDYFRAMGVEKVTVHRTADGSGVPVIDIPPRGAKKGTLVVHIAMANSLDENQLYQLATLAGINPEYRIIGFGNPSSDRYYVKEQDLSWNKLLSIVFRKRPYALIAAELDYLAVHNIHHHYQIGYSFGALKAAIESSYIDSEYLRGLLLIDPSARPRSPMRLWKDFSRTYGPLGKYVNSAELELYHQARGAAAKDRTYKRAFLRPINIANALLVARSRVLAILQYVRRTHPTAKMAIAWGTASELGDDRYMRDSLEKINATLDAKPVVPIRLPDLEHAFANDVHIYAAIVRQFLTTK